MLPLKTYWCIDTEVKMSVIIANYSKESVMSTIQKKIDQISDIFMKVSGDRKTLKNFLSDILSPGEIEDIHNRLMIIEGLVQNKTQREVSKDLNVSISKVTRASNVIKYGSGLFPKLFKAKK